jgi:Dockerin type I domain
VLNKSKAVISYNPDGNVVGSWTANGLGTEPEGLTRDPSVDPQTGKNDLWIASRDRKILWYDDAASHTSGTYTNNMSFTPSMSGNLKGIVTDGTYLWVVTEGSTDYVYRYTITRSSSTGDPTSLTQTGLWKLPSVNSKPTGITIDPTNASMSIWVVDESTDRVYEYANSRGMTVGTGTVSKWFQLDSNNLAPQGIADPQWQTEEIVSAQVLSSATPIVNPFHNAFKSVDVNNDGIVTPADALLVINLLNDAAEGQNRKAGLAARFVDVNDDGKITPTDALLVINELNSSSSEETEDSSLIGGGEASSLASMQFFADLGDEEEDGGFEREFDFLDDLARSRRFVSRNHPIGLKNA